MRILVACEFSGIVRDAFRSRGHDAWSCDLLETETSDGCTFPNYHYKDDVRRILCGATWQLMIAFPPCTDLAVSGARYFVEKRANGRQQAAIDFFMALVNAPIDKIAIENPVGIMSTGYRKPDQIIQPWQFGHDASKATCLWLKNLPPLKPTNIIEPQRYGCRCGYKFEAALGKYGCPNCCGDKGAARLIWGNQTPTGQNNVWGGTKGAHERSRTYQGIADAMAEQWAESSR